MRTSLAAALALAGAALAGAPAASNAGPLAETARGVDNKQDTHTSHDPAPPPSSDPDPSPPASDHDDCSSCSSSTVVVGAGAGLTAGGYATVEESGPSEPLLAGPARLDLYLGVHPVVDSDGATLGEVRGTIDWIGLAMSGVRYVEHVEDDKREDDVSVWLGTFSITGRVLAWNRTEIWLDGGLAMSGSSEYSSMLGTAWSIRGEHAIDPDLGLRGQVRYYALEHEVSALEAWAGVRAWFLQAGYRVLDFNAGPPLHGPEAGLALRF